MKLGSLKINILLLFIIIPVSFANDEFMELLKKENLFNTIQQESQEIGITEDDDIKYNLEEELDKEKILDIVDLEEEIVDIRNLDEDLKK